MVNYGILCGRVVELAKETGKLIREEAMRFTIEDIEAKGLHDYVSYVDRQAEEMLVTGLKEFLPDSTFIAEEGTAAEGPAPYKWIVDPLDGTTNFIHGLPPYSISIALMHENKLVLGVVYEITLDECFYSWEGSPVYLNDTKVKVSDAVALSQSLISTGFPYNDFSRMRQFITTLEYFMKNTHGLRRLGSAAVDLAYVACGRFDAFYEYSLKPWDVAAGAFLVQQAGGKVSDFNGNGNFLFGEEIVAANPLVFEEFLTIIRSFMKVNGK
jgi:myo-inositol-1(or 4)-monophosphatase